MIWHNTAIALFTQFMVVVFALLGYNTSIQTDVNKSQRQKSQIVNSNMQCNTGKKYTTVLQV